MSIQVERMEVVKMAVNKVDIQNIVRAIGGKENIKSATHCVTRLRLILKDYDLVDKSKLSQNPLVKGQFKSDNQYQIVIGPGTVDEAYRLLIDETQATAISKEEAKEQAIQKGNLFQRLIKLLSLIHI